MRIDFSAVIEEIKQEGIQFPVVVRFHDVLRTQVETLNRVFNETIQEADYQGEYNGVYPVKVNQMREVVEEIVDAGKPFNYGLEAGSKAELITVLAYNTNPDSLTILNGYKDEEFMRLALLGTKLGRKMVVNIVMMGFFCAVTGVVSKEAALEAVKATVPPRTIELNSNAFEMGYNHGLEAND